MYLEDVDSLTGTHVCVKGSHRRIPWSLHADGCMTDSAVKGTGLWVNVTELHGLAGTIMAVNTIGLHKGKTPVNSDRLALENEFSASLFGLDYEITHFEPTEIVRKCYAEVPWVSRRYRTSVAN